MIIWTRFASEETDDELLINDVPNTLNLIGCLTLAWRHLHLTLTWLLQYNLFHCKMIMIRLIYLPRQSLYVIFHVKTVWLRFAVLLNNESMFKWSQWLFLCSDLVILLWCLFVCFFPIQHTFYYLVYFMMNYINIHYY